MRCSIQDYPLHYYLIEKCAAVSNIIIVGYNLISSFIKSYLSHTSVIIRHLPLEGSCIIAVSPMRRKYLLIEFNFHALYNI